MKSTLKLTGVGSYPLVVRGYGLYIKCCGFKSYALPTVFLRFRSYLMTPIMYFE